LHAFTAFSAIKAL